MKIQRLQIEQQMMRIRVESQRAALSIDYPAQRQMRIDRQDAKMTVKKEQPKIKLDMQDFCNHHGMQDIGSFTAKSAAQACEDISQNIREIVSDGNTIARVPNNGNPIAELAKSKMLKVETPDMDGGVPYGPVKMDGDPGAIRMDWSKYDLKIIWDKYQSPEINVKPKASVDARVVQDPYIKCTVVEQTIPPEKGAAFDEKI